MAELQKKIREAKRGYFDKNLRRRPERESRTISQDDLASLHDTKLSSSHPRKFSERLPEPYQVIGARKKGQRTFELAGGGGDDTRREGISRATGPRNLSSDIFCFRSAKGVHYRGLGEMRWGYCVEVLACVRREVVKGASDWW